MCYKECDKNVIKDGKLKAVYLMQSSYNYPIKIMKALEKNNEKYLKSCIERGKLIIINN